MLNSHSPNPFDPNFAARIEGKYGIKLLGTYNDTEGNTGGFVQTVDFTSTGGSSVITDITADAPSSSVDWLEMTATTGSFAHTVLLIETIGGLGPADGPNVSDSRSMVVETLN